MSVPDHFGLFGLPERFDIDVNALDEKYRELSRLHHPDKHAQGTSTERLAAVTKTADLNAAYKTLREDFTRAEHLLRRRGVETSEAETQDRRATVEGKLLVEVLELREMLEDAKDAKDRARVEKLGDEVGVRSQRAWKTLREGFASADPDHGALGKALTSLRYYRRVLEEVNNILDAEDA
jgi:Fe-S protein assembly co-chaperone HscB